MVATPRVPGALMPAGLRHVMTRFPIPAAFALAATALSLVTGTSIPFEVNDEASRTLALLLLALFATTAARLWGERTGAAPLVHGGVAALLVAALAARVYTFPIENSLCALMLAPGVVTLASTLPFAGRGGDGDRFWWFNQAAWIGSLIALVAALALALGLMLAYTAMDELLGFDVGDIYQHTWTVSLGLVWPLVALGLAPALATAEPRDPGRLVKLLVTWVLVPVVGLYLIILYLYIGRIALAGTLPSGEIAPMVGGCAAFAVATHYLAYPLRERGARWVRAFHRQLFRLLLAPAVVLAYAVWVRIAAYGFTETRFTLALLTLWVLALAVHGLAWPARRIALFPALLCAGLLLGSFGPWGAIAVSERSQVRILRDLLERQGILVEGRIVPTDAKPEPEAAQRIGSVISYLFDTGKAATVAGWFVTAPESWPAALEAMGVGYVEPWLDPGIVSFWSAPVTARDVRGFDFSVAVSTYEGGWQRVVLPYEAGPFEIMLTLSSGVLTVTTKDGLFRQDLLVVAEKARDLMKPDGAAEPIPLDLAGPSGRTRLLIENLQANTTDDRLTVTSFSATMLFAKPAD